MSRRAATGVGAALALLVLVSPGAAGKNPDPVAPPEVREMAIRAAASMGDPYPTSGRAYETTRDQVKAILQWADSEIDRPVYLVVVRGNFVGASLTRPAGAPTQTGRIIAMVWDPAKKQVTDFYLGDNELDTVALGRGLSLGY